MAKVCFCHLFSQRFGKITAGNINIVLDILEKGRKKEYYVM